jgi:hypothetical protein
MQDISQETKMALQSAVMYSINLAFYIATFAFGDKINLDIHPVAGSIGLDGCYDCHPGEYC